MRLLLDTHTVLWWLDGSSRLGPAARDVLSRKENEAWFSVVTAWEVALKISLGKLRLSHTVSDLAGELQKSAFQCLAITADHCDKVAQLPFHHRDPFDRMLIAQALTENLHLVSADATLDLYGVPRIW